MKLKKILVCLKLRKGRYFFGKYFKDLNDLNKAKIYLNDLNKAKIYLNDLYKKC